MAGATEDGGIWWVSNDGILGLHHPIFDGLRGSSSRIGRAEGGRRSVSGAPTPVRAPTHPITYYPSAYLSDRSTYSPVDDGPQGTISTEANVALLSSSVVGGEENRIQSVNALYLGPYLHEFQSSDDYHAAWQTIKTSQSCSLIPDREVLDQAVGLDDFKGWGTFGYIHISSHGDNFYQGLRGLWNPLWGPSDFLTGSLSLVGVYTGINLPSDPSGDLDISGYEDDIQTKRLAIGVGGTLVILPSFFAAYLEPLPNSLVVVATCRSGYNSSLFNVLRSKGAGAFVGFDDYVLSTYAQNTTNEIIRSMLNGDTFSEAVSSARAMFGSSDGGMDDARLIAKGNGDLKLGSGDELSNGDFETGSLTPWMKEGDGRIIQQLGGTPPTGGSFMGIISTGLGFTTQTGQISQPVCLPESATRLTFDWNFFSEEFLEYCDTQFDDAFRVDLCEGDDSPACSTVFDTSVNALCQNSGALSKSSISFDEGDVYDTGWQNQQVDITEFSGSRVNVQFFSTDKGDSIFDTAILLDNINVE